MSWMPTPSRLQQSNGLHGTANEDHGARVSMNSADEHKAKEDRGSAEEWLVVGRELPVTDKPLDGRQQPALAASPAQRRRDLGVGAGNSCDHAVRRLTSRVDNASQTEVRGILDQRRNLRGFPRGRELDEASR